MRASELAARYGSRFELQQDAAGALLAYEYLDILDQALAAWRMTPPSGIVMHDVGCASFAYASALVAVWNPCRLVGVELEGYRRLRGGVNRAEKAATNVARLPGVSFVISDYSTLADPADLVTAFFPFVTPAPVLGWRLPLTVLQPRSLFNRIRANIGPEGSLWMVNHGEVEASVAAGYASDSGLERIQRHVCKTTLRVRPAPPVVSAWRATR